MSKNVYVEKIIGSKAADDDLKGNKVFEVIKENSQNCDEDIIIDFNNIELVNTAFLNNAIGKLFDKQKYNISKNKIKIVNLQETMVELLKESISVANQKYS
ncbi:MAG: STAS-like domain-containing protein [Lachnospiraceae bacterium]|nr:STAS-like domain-containing protein [Lachnospiraceae bacterium]